MQEVDGETFAVSECDSVRDIVRDGPLSKADVDALIRVCNSPAADTIRTVAGAFCKAVEDSAVIADNRTILGESAIRGVITAMDSHADDLNVQYHGCEALKALVVDNNANRSSAIEMGAISILSNAWAFLRDAYPALLVSPVSAIGSLVTTASIELILEDGWLDRTLVLMWDEEDDARVHGGLAQRHCSMTNDPYTLCDGLEISIPTTPMCRSTRRAPLKSLRGGSDHPTQQLCCPSVQL